MYNSWFIFFLWIRSWLLWCRRVFVYVYLWVLALFFYPNRRIKVDFDCSLYYRPMLVCVLLSISFLLFILAVSVYWNLQIKILLPMSLPWLLEPAMQNLSVFKCCCGLVVLHSGCLFYLWQRFLSFIPVLDYCVLYLCLVYLILITACLGWICVAMVYMLSNYVEVEVVCEVGDWFMIKHDGWTKADLQWCLHHFIEMRKNTDFRLREFALSPGDAKYILSDVRTPGEVQANLNEFITLWLREYGPGHQLRSIAYYQVEFVIDFPLYQVFGFGFLALIKYFVFLRPLM